MLGPPVALVMCIVALVQDSSKAYAIAGLLLSAAACLLWLLPVVCT